MGDSSSDQATVDVTSRMLEDLAEELGITHQRLAGALSDVQEVTTTAMDIALRLDTSEKSRLETLAELSQVREVCDVELEELRVLCSDQAETISRQAAYITRLRTQVRHPLRIVAKRALSPFITKRGDGNK